MEKRLMQIMFILTLSVVVFTACKSGRQLAGSESVLSERSITDLAIAAQPNFSSLDIKRMNLNINMGNGTSYSSPATCRIISDSVIHLSVQPFFGIEMFTAQFTNNRFVVLDKIKKVAYSGNYDLFSKGLGINIDYSMLEALLTNRLFVLNNQGGPLSRLKAERKAGTTSLQHNFNHIRQQFVLNSDYRIQRTDISTSIGKYRFTANYEGFTNQSTLIFPSQLSVNAEAGSKKYDLSMSITRMMVNEQLSIPDISLQGYRTGNIEQLLK